MRLIRRLDRRPVNTHPSTPPRGPDLPISPSTTHNSPVLVGPLSTHPHIPSRVLVPARLVSSAARFVRSCIRATSSGAKWSARTASSLSVASSGFQWPEPFRCLDSESCLCLSASTPVSVGPSVSGAVRARVGKGTGGDGRTRGRLLEAVAGARRQGEASTDDDAAHGRRPQAARGDQIPGGQHGRLLVVSEMFPRCFKVRAGRPTSCALGLDMTVMR